MVPDVVLSCVALFAAFKLLRNYRDGLGRLILAACAGGWLFLGVLDFTYGISNGMYFLDHSFSLILLSIGLGLPVLGLVTIWAIYRSNTTESVNSA